MTETGFLETLKRVEDVAVILTRMEDINVVLGKITTIEAFIDRFGTLEALITPIRDKIAISCMLRQIHESSSHAIRHGLYIKNRKRLFCP